MKTALFQPTPPLSGFVSRFFFYEGFIPSHSIDMFLPDGETELIIELTGKPQFIYDAESLKPKQECIKAWISGVRTKPIFIPSGLNSRMVIISFKKGRTWPFYRFPMTEIADQVIHAEDALSGFRDFYWSLVSEDDPDNLFKLTERYLLQLGKDKMESSTQTSCIHYSIQHLTSNPGVKSLAELARVVGYSQKHFIDLFRKQVGVTPREFTGILRFQRVIHLLDGTDTPDWQQIILSCGFYDQSHFIHEFRRYSGMTPETYFKKKGPFLNYLPVA